MLFNDITDSNLNNLSMTILFFIRQNYFLKMNELIQSSQVKAYFFQLNSCYKVFSFHKFILCFIEFGLQLYNRPSSFYWSFMLFWPVVTQLNPLSLHIPLFPLKMCFRGRWLEHSGSTPLKIGERVRFPSVLVVARVDFKTTNLIVCSKNSNWSFTQRTFNNYDYLMRFEFTHQS